MRKMSQGKSRSKSRGAEHPPGVSFGSAITLHDMGGSRATQGPPKKFAEYEAKDSAVPAWYKQLKKHVTN